MAWPKRQFASTLDTAVLVFFILLVLVIAWWVLAAVVGTLIFLAKLALLAFVLALGLRSFFWVRGRLRGGKGLVK